MKILIVDDEPKIRKGLENLIEKLNFRWSVVGCAEDGLAALKLMQYKKPDVLLLDIRMPDMDGFELLDKLYSCRKDVIIIIISGHAEFEYAQKAVRYGVLDYILKPVNPQKVKDVLEKAERIIAERNRHEINYVYLKNSINELREKFLYDVIFETVFISSDEAKEKCEMLNITIDNFCVATLRIDLDMGNEDCWKSLFNNVNIKELIYDVIYKNHGGYVLCNGIGSFVIIIRLGSRSEIERQIETIEKQLISCFDGTIGVSLGFGGIYDDILMASASYRESLFAITNGLSSFRLKPEIAHHKPLVISILESIKNRPQDYCVLIRQSIDYIIRNYDKNIKLNDIAKSIYVNQNYLSELFKKETGINISDFIVEYRVEKAKELLLKLENKVYMVAEKVGFKDQRYFSQVFRKKTGMTPAEYREKNYIEFRCREDS